jgi:hypothetical protein
MELDIREIPTIIISNTQSDYQQRQKLLMKDMKKYGFYNTFIHIGLEPDDLSPADRNSERLSAKEICICESHIEALEMARDHLKGDHFLILEDDCMFVGAEWILKDLPENFDYIKLGGSYHYHLPTEIGERYMKDIHSLNLHATLYKRSSIQTVMDGFLMREESCDADLAKLVEVGDVIGYSVIKEIFWQRGTTSPGEMTLLSTKEQDFRALRSAKHLLGTKIMNRIEIK